MRRNLFRACALACLLALAAVAGLAQSQPTPTPERKSDNPPVMGRMGRRQLGRHERGERRGVERRVLGRLNLSDAQRQQLRDIESRYAGGFRSRREELRGIMETRRQGGTLTAEQQERVRKLREEMRADSGRMRDEIRGLLTDEQRTQLQRMREELKQRHEQRRLRRDELRERRLKRPAPPDEDDE